MRDPDEFDAFYKFARERLLLQTFALTGDLNASRNAVRDSFIVAWHHWRKVGALENPEDWARPLAWTYAQRRNTARLGHRDKRIDPGLKATIDALAKLPTPQRKALLLTQLAAVSMGQMAREIGLPLHDAERDLQTATAQFSIHRDVSSTEIRPKLEQLTTIVEEVTWPRPSILRRAGAARRRTHTAIGVVGSLAALVLTGSLVTDATGVRPTLDRDHVSVSGDRSAAPPTEAPEEALPESALLTAAQVDNLVDGQGWTVTRTDDNAKGSGLALPCQQERYADPKGVATLLRTFGSDSAKPGRQAGVFQSTEVSATTRAARRTFKTTRHWYAGCVQHRVQLLSTRRVGLVGDEASLLVLRSWNEPAKTMVVGVARTGRLTTTTMSVAVNQERPNFTRSARLLATAVDGLCGLPDGGACGGVPGLEVVSPFPVGKRPALLSEVDLPPVADVNRPWVGTEPIKAQTNVASTSCDDADFNNPFDAHPFSNNLTRSFLIPEAELPAQFGLTQTVGSLPARQATAFVEQIRQKLTSCPERDLGTDVENLAHVDTLDMDLSAWLVTTEISDKESVRYLMAIARTGTSVTQIGFVPSGPITMGDDAFVALAYRALDRLDRLPPPRGD